MPLLHFLSPSSCAICQRETKLHPLCPQCAGLFLPGKIPSANRCAVCFQEVHGEGPADTEFSEVADDAAGTGCEYCSSRHVFFDSFRALFPLDEHARALVHRWKFENERRLFRIFVEPLVPVIREREVDRIGFISAGRHRRFTRSFEPVEDLARAVSEKTGIPAGGDLVKTRRRKQSGARYEERFFDISGSLSLTASFRTVKHYLLLEDIFTTGATANESARLLKKAGVETVEVIALFQRQRDGISWSPSHKLEKGISIS